MKTKKQLQQWADNLSLEDRWTIQLFVIQLYAMEMNDD